MLGILTNGHVQSVKSTSAGRYISLSFMSVCGLVL